MSAHTPGPWEFAESEQGEDDQRFFIVSSRGVVGYWQGHKDRHQNDYWLLTEADARLIAAAPELLASLVGYMAAVELMNAAMNDGVNVQGAISNLMGWEDQAKDAIAKATGGQP